VARGAKRLQLCGKMMKSRSQSEKQKPESRSQESEEKKIKSGSQLYHSGF
jgi:hypothetical protein